MSYSKIKHALNSTLGTEEFKPLDRIMRDLSAIRIPYFKLSEELMNSPKRDIMREFNAIEFLANSGREVTLLELNQSGVWITNYFDVSFYPDNIFFECFNRGLSGEVIADLGYFKIKSRFNIQSSNTSYGRILIQSPYSGDSLAFGIYKEYQSTGRDQITIRYPYPLLVNKLKISVRFDPFSKASKFETYKNNRVAYIAVRNIGTIFKGE